MCACALRYSCRFGFTNLTCGETVSASLVLDFEATHPKLDGPGDGFEAENRSMEVTTRGDNWGSNAAYATFFFHCHALNECALIAHVKASLALTRATH